jgi:hypothetical protein
MKIFTEIKNSIYSPEYYKEVLQKPMSYSIKYFFKFVLIFSFILAIIFSFVYLPKVKIFFDNFGMQLVNAFPSNLEVEIKNSQAFSLSPQPYFIKTPSDFKTNNGQTNFENLITIDVNNVFDLNKFNSFNTLSVLNKDSISYIENNKISIQPLKGVPNFVANRENLSDFVNKVTPLLKFIYLVIPAGLFAGIYMSFIFYLFYLIFGALVIWIILKIKKINIEYKKAYQIGIHILTPALIINTALSNFGFVYPLLFTMLLIIFTIINIRNFSTPIAQVKE